MTPITKIIVNKKAEALFKKRASRRLPKEYLELLFGYILHGVVNICKFVPIEQEATNIEVSYNAEDYYKHADIAESMELNLIGSIHTHPNTDLTIFSEGDLLTHISDPVEKIIGICAFEPKSGDKTRGRWRIAYWPTVTPLPVEYLKDKS